jgi:UrcA family protein
MFIFPRSPIPTLIGLLTVVALSGLGGSPASAQAATLADGLTASRGSSYSAVVHFGDLDLNRAQGAAVLYARIRAAADRVCGAPDRLPSLGLWAANRSCRSQAIERAVQRVDSPALQEIHAARTAVRPRLAKAAIDDRPT